MLASLRPGHYGPCRAVHQRHDSTVVHRRVRHLLGVRAAVVNSLFGRQRRRHRPGGPRGRRCSAHAARPANPVVCQPPHHPCDAVRLGRRRATASSTCDNPSRRDGSCSNARTTQFEHPAAATARRYVRSAGSKISDIRIRSRIEGTWYFRRPRQTSRSARLISEGVLPQVTANSDRHLAAANYSNSDAPTTDLAPHPRSASNIYGAGSDDRTLSAANFAIWSSVEYGQDAK